MQNSELKSRITKLETELNSYLGNEHDMTDDNIRMRNQVELLREELKLTKELYHKAHENHDRIVAQSKAALVDEKTQLELRVHDLEDKLSEATKKYAKAVGIYKKVSLVDLSKVVRFRYSSHRQPDGKAQTRLHSRAFFRYSKTCVKQPF